jgi:uncharacterized membrane protein
MFIKLYFITLPILFLTDMVWLGLLARSFYAKQIGFLMKVNINWFPAILFYLIFSAGLVLFVIAPAMEKRSWVSAVLLGGFLGFIAYAAYDLTNLATIKDWPFSVALVDLMWGTLLASVSSVIVYFIAIKLGL